MSMTVCLPGNKENMLEGSVLQRIRSSTDTAITLKMALRAVAPSTLASALEAGIDCLDFLPSHTTILRHRATLYWGFCLLRRELNEQALALGGQVSWFMIDSSPQGHVDYVLSARSSMPWTSLDQCFQDAMLLAENAPNEDATAETEAAMERLTKVVAFQAGVPTSVGSGRAGLQFKLHAFIHALRLESCSWDAVTDTLQGMVSVTSDLGTEAGVAHAPAFRLSELFSWIESPSQCPEEPMFEFAPQPQAQVGNAQLQDFQFQSLGGPHTLHANPVPASVAVAACDDTDLCFQPISTVSQQTITEAEEEPDFEFSRMAPSESVPAAFVPLG